MNEEKKKLLKKYLSIATVILSALWIILFSYGLFFEVKINAKIEEKLAQTHIVDITQPASEEVQSQDDGKKIDEELSKQISQISPQRPNLGANIEKAKISIIVTNLGTNKDLTQQALSLPRTITLGFSPYTTSLKEYYHQAVKNGFDIFIYMPFEPSDYPTNDPGPYAILEDNSSDKNLSIIKNMLANFPGTKGIYANYRENISLNEKAFSSIIDLITQKNMNILLGRDFSHDQSKYLQNHQNVIPTDIIIDMVPDPNVIKHSLNNLLSLAKSKKFAVGYINTYPITLKVLSEWLANLNDPEIEIVPLSSLLSN